MIENAENTDTIRQVDRATTDLSGFEKQYADCVVLTQDGRLLLQTRPVRDKPGANHITAFGGHLDPGETPGEALVREMNEELGAVLQEEDAVFIGAITEAFIGHRELLHVYFWHDRQGTITGCYEWDPIYFDTVGDALSHPEVMDYMRWALKECQKRGLIG